MMIFHSKQNKLNVNEIPIIKINGMSIERVTEFKLFGVLIDSNLTWSPHCNYIQDTRYTKLYFTSVCVQKH